MSIPNGSKLPAIIQGIFYYHNPYHFLIKCRKKYGRIFKIKLPGFTPMIVVTDPKDVKQIFAADADKLHAGEANAVYFVETFGKHSLLTLDGAMHLRHRKLISPPLHGQALKNYETKIITITNDVFAELQSITLQVILSVIFGIEKGKHFDDLYSTLIELLHTVENPFISFITGVFPSLLKYQSPKVKKLIAKIDVLLYQQIQYRRTHSSDASDMLNILINAKDESGNGLSDKELRDELLTLLIAGHDTTATTMAWVMYYALSHPDVYKKIKIELTEPAQKIIFLPHVIKETQRYQPIIPLVARVSHSPLNIGAYKIPNGYTLVPCIYLAGNDPDFWEYPNRFMPERFFETSIEPSHYFPFGGGIRRCIGAAFAMFEMQIVLSQIFNRFEISLKPNYIAKPLRQGIAFAPKGGVPIVVNITK